jgi:hypothetical protein
MEVSQGNCEKNAMLSMPLLHWGGAGAERENFSNAPVPTAPSYDDGND